MGGLAAIASVKQKGRSKAGSQIRKCTHQSVL
jgi:hypothetical protein